MDKYINLFFFFIIMINYNKKIKYIENKIKKEQIKDKKIESETILKLIPLDCKKKNKIILKKFLHPTDYQIKYKIKKNNICHEKNRYDGQDFGPGRGFGNLNINNEIRNGINTRADNNNFKKKSEKEINNRFNFLDKNYQNINNIIFPYTRGGEITRKQLDKNKNFNYNKK